MGIEHNEWLIHRRSENERILGEADERRRELLRHGYAWTKEHARVDMVVRPALAYAEPLSVGRLKLLARQVEMAGHEVFPDGGLRVVAGGLISSHDPREEYVDVTGLAAFCDVIPVGNMPGVFPSVPGVIHPARYWASVAMLTWSAKTAHQMGRGGTIAATASPGWQAVRLRGHHHDQLDCAIGDRTYAPMPCLGGFAVQVERFIGGPNDCGGAQSA